ncbi:MAG: putative toxin-antitoxin system toxin component, PIN family [Sulfuritalea sp.]|nr:putative toxin-antitoxin system toxin component, PIN family [Sulfuritalea sp.]MDP1984680.1 putative toxin-antitoxin system toxin component, PIN family [Sulfuritalea sp.]
MRLVLDTNVVVAGLLWSGHPRQLLDLAINGDVALFSSPALIEELAHTLNYPKFSQRIAAHCATTPSALTVRYSALVTLVTPSEVPRVIEQDADDDQVLACALAANANLIVSGDKHLHSLGGAYQGIRIATPAEAIHSVGAK